MKKAGDHIETTDNQDLADLFRRASRLIARVYHRRDHAHHAQGHVLSIIRERGSINQGELLEILDVRSSSLSEIIRKLERKGLITRERNEKDRRGFIVSAIERPDDQPPDPCRARESSGNFFTCLDDEEQVRLRTILEKIIASVKEDPLSREPGCSHHKQGGGRRHGRGKRRLHDE